MANTILGSTIVFAPYSVDQALEGLAEVGYKHVEIGAVKGWFEHIDADTADDAEISRIQRKLDELGLTVVSLSGHAPLHTVDGKERFKKVMDIAVKLGVKIVNTNSGETESDEDVERFYQHMDEICDYAEARGLTIGLETDSNLIPTAKAGLAVLDRINRPGLVGFNYDPGNVIYYAGADPTEDIKHALPQMVHFHLKDKIGGEKVFHFPALGTGEIPLASLIEQCKEAGFTGPISAEVEFDENGWPSYQECLAAARTSADHLRKIGVLDGSSK